MNHWKEYKHGILDLMELNAYVDSPFLYGDQFWWCAGCRICHGLSANLLFVHCLCSGHRIALHWASDMVVMSSYIFMQADFYCIKEIEGILPKGPYLPCVSMAGRVLLARYHRNLCMYYLKVKCGRLHQTVLQGCTASIAIQQQSPSICL